MLQLRSILHLKKSFEPKDGSLPRLTEYPGNTDGIRGRARGDKECVFFFFPSVKYMDDEIDSVRKSHRFTNPPL